MTSAAAPEPITRAKVLRTVKGSAAVGGLSLAGVLAIAYPWAQGVSAEQGTIKADVKEVKDDVGDVRVSIEGVRRDVADVSKTTSTVRDMKRSVEATESRIAALEASRASIETSLRFIVENLGKMDAKLERALDRK